MNRFIEEIVTLISEAVSLSTDEIRELVEIPPDDKLGDYAFPCFILSKKLKKAPDKIASDLASNLKPAKLIAEIYSIGPYLNFKVNKTHLAEFVLSQIFDQGENCQ